MSTRVVCAGDSITRGQLGVDYTAMLCERTAGRPFAFVAEGVNGDLAYNLLQRLDAVIEQKPDLVTVLIGTNDVRAALSEKHAREMRRRKKLPAAPTMAWYRENLEAIVARLDAGTGARIALLSPPVLGQEPGSRPVLAAGEYSRVVRETAAKYGAAYLPLYERQLAHLRTIDGASAPPYRDGPGLRNRAIRQYLLLNRSWDEISRRHGLELTTDLIHQNSRGAAHIADLIEEFIDDATR